MENKLTVINAVIQNQSVERQKAIQQFRWRMQNGDYVRPHVMETRHLFFTLRMIWNHSVPDKYRLKPYKKYQFRDFYTAGYMQLAIMSVSLELSKRDIPEKWMAQLKSMIDSMGVLYGNRIEK